MSSTVTFGCFPYSSAVHPPSGPRNLFSENKKVSYYYGGQLHDNIRDTIRLKEPADKLATDRYTDDKRKLLGSDLYQGWENLRAVPPEVLHSPAGCYKWIEKWENDNKADYASQHGKYTVISPRHYMIEIAMQLFQSSNYSIACTHLGGGKIVLSRADKPQAHFASKNVEMSKKICHSGYAFEELLTKGPRNIEDPVFVVTEAKLGSDISLVLRCELDSYNAHTDNFTELKCYAPLKMHNVHHREKLLKTYVQIGLVPGCDLLVGIRNTQMGLLQDLQYFTKDDLYDKITNRSLPRAPEKFSLNPDIAAEWLQYCIENICKLVGARIEGSEPQSFMVTLDECHNIHLKELERIPAYVELPAH